MSYEIRGGCHCGQVRYTVTEAPVTQLICHCRPCLERTGPVTGVMFVSKAACDITGDTRIHNDVGGSGCAIETHRCSNCGSAIGWWAEKVPLMWLVTAASLDDDSDFTPAFHQWVSQRPRWVSIDDSLPQFEHAAQWDSVGGRPDFGTGHS